MPNLDHILMTKNSKINKIVTSERIINTYVMKIIFRAAKLSWSGKRSLDIHAVVIYLSIKNNIITTANSNILTAFNVKAPSKIDRYYFAFVPIIHVKFQIIELLMILLFQLRVLMK